MKGYRGIQNERFNSGDVATSGCPVCKVTDGQIKIGFNTSGSRRYKCKRCGKKYTPQDHVIKRPLSPLQQLTAKWLDKGRSLPEVKSKRKRKRRRVSSQYR